MNRSVVAVAIAIAVLVAVLAGVGEAVVWGHAVPRHPPTGVRR